MSDKRYLCWYPKQPKPETLPEGCEVLTDVGWQKEIDPPPMWVSHGRRWLVPEYIYHTHMFCEAYGISIPAGYEVIDFRSPNHSDEMYLSSLNVPSKDGWNYGHLYPILRKIEPQHIYHTPLG